MSGPFSGNMLLVGAGNMGGAMLRGWLAAGASPAKFSIYDPGLTTAPDGVTLLSQLPVEPAAGWLLLAIKPQMLKAAAPAIRQAVGPETKIVSILAGIEIEVLRAWFPNAHSITRAMPNLAASIGKSPVALVTEGSINLQDRNALTTMMSALGSAEWLEHEDQLDLVTALAGSGPAFVYRFIDALAAGAADLGMEPAQAQRLAVSMVEGAAMLAAASPYPPAELARRVASPGGVTQVGLDRLDRHDALRHLISQTLAAARDRSVEMSAEIGQASKP